MAGKVICVGVGPGDLELLTLRAVKALKAADVVCSPTARPGRVSFALSIVQPILEERSDKPEVLELVFPMVKDEERLREVWRRNADAIAERCRVGKTVAYLVVGDQALYSTFTYVHRELGERYPDVEVEIVPGVTSITDFAAKAGLSLGERGDTIAIVPACYDLSRVKGLIAESDTLIFIKDGRHFKEVLSILQEAGLPKDSLVAFAHDIDMPGGGMKIMKLGEVSNLEMIDKYFSMLIVRRGPS